MRHLFKKIMLVVLICGAASPGYSFEPGQFAVIAGVAPAVRTGERPRYGLDLTFGTMRKTYNFRAMGIVVGSARPADGEFYIGPSYAQYDIVSAYFESVAQFKQSKYSGLRLTAGFGFAIALAFTSIGYSNEQMKPTTELGVMVKFPIFWVR
jgi:hypothetical protein